MDAFLAAVATRALSPILSFPAESLHSHLVAWSTEHSRLTGRTITT